MTHPYLRTYEVHLRAGSLSETTITDRMEILTRLDRDLPQGLPRSTTQELEQWIGRPDWKPATRHTYHGHLVAFFKWALETDHVDYDPTRHMRRPKAPDAVPDPISNDEMRHTLAMANDRWRRICTLAGYAGLRAAEIGALRREHVTERRLLVKNGKGGRDAYVPTSPEVWAVVEPVTTELVVPSRFGEQISGHGMSGIARAFFRRIGLPGVHLHQLRHWYCTSLLEAGVDLPTVSKLMRHRSVNTTMGYLAIVDSRREAAVRLLPHFGAGGILPAAFRQDPLAA